MEVLKTVFDWFIGLGGAAITTLFIVVLSLIVGVRLSKSLEGGLRMGIALAGMSAVIGLLTNTFAPALQAFVERTGTNLDILDLGWSQMALVTWSSLYTVIFAIICLFVNLVMLFFKWTDTINADVFNVWHLSIIGLLVLYYTKNFFASIIFVIVLYILMLINADLVKPKLNTLLGYDDDNATTSGHPVFLMNPVVMVFDKLLTKLFPNLDKYDFDEKKLNEKIGFWGSNFAVGIYLGILIGILGRRSVADTISMSLTAGVCLELFSIVGGWFGPAMKPLSRGLVAKARKKHTDRKLYVGVEWTIAAVRPEIWTVANILAPILMLIAMFLPGNRTLPLGGIILTALVPSLFFITGGKVLRMTIIGVILIPIYLWASTGVAEFITNVSKQLNVFPSGLSEATQFTSIEAIPQEKIITILFGKIYQNPEAKGIILFVVLVLVYFALFIWYAKNMKKENAVRLKKRKAAAAAEEEEDEVAELATEEEEKEEVVEKATKADEEDDEEVAELATETEEKEKEEVAELATEKG